MRWTLAALTLAACGVLALVTPGCDDERIFGEEPANPAFNGTFDGNVFFDRGPNGQITLDGDLTSLEVYFVANGPGEGEMRFFDAQDVEVLPSLLTNGNCGTATASLPTQMVTFARPVRRITFQPIGDGQTPLPTALLDMFHVNP